MNNKIEMKMKKESIDNVSPFCDNAGIYRM